ncbi:hypothetical protein [Lichenibacterium dinghuense]|uniref:hypothetical protein n=1 Tax=Lichenibacterium dinghuense TaxID=2895977 RepID=UPI001F36B477|nr:hypothetical protein [Lichenibacterium sp. 6Y81]
MRSMLRCGARAVAAAVLLAPGAARAAVEPLPVDAAVLSEARAVGSLPCAGGTKAGGFAPDEDAPAAWRIGDALVSVRRKQGDRLAFVLARPAAGSADCAVRDVVVLPRGGSLLACALQDDSVRGLGVHALLPSGRRDLLFWRVDGTGLLRRQGTAPDDDDFESDTGELICSLPDPIQ